MFSLLIIAMFSLVDLQRPTLSIAQSIIESGGNTKAIGKVGEKGAFQVQERYWGKVPKTFMAQAKQAESILNLLTKENKGDIIKGLERYNGYGKPAERYAQAVITKAFELTLLGV